MCYIVYMRVRKRRVGVRELRQNLSRYLKRVNAGETFEVTERGRAVAVLGPLPESATALGRLIAHGRALAPNGDLRDMGMPPAPAVRIRLAEALEAEREERL